MKAYLELDNGMVFEGNAFGAIAESTGEVVFNTGMTGYQEILTDPSYYGQIVVMTYPLIGNYGINFEDFESKRSWVRGFIVREYEKSSSNFRSEIELDDYLKSQGIMGIEGLDTRQLARILRESGTIKGRILLKAPDVKTDPISFDISDAVYQVTCNEKKQISQLEGKKVALWDFGAKHNIAKEMVKRNCAVTLYPATSTAKDILDTNPDLVFLSNGPGNPEDLHEIISELKKLIGIVPIAGICLGHQLLALALGGQTEKLKYGHRGCNHPVKDLRTGKTMLTSQNHGYHVSVLPSSVQATHVSVNDGSIEGMKHTDLPIFSVQFHPEASPGPIESGLLFDEFLAVSMGRKYAVK